MAAVLEHWREAATLMLVTPSETQSKVDSKLYVSGSDDSSLRSKCKQTDNFEILLLKRSGKSKFLPNRYVFPGGAAVNSDFSSEWSDLFSQIGMDLQKELFAHVSRGSQHAAPMFTRTRDPSFSAITPEVAFRICAIRETFEESGVLLACPVKHLSNFRGMLFSPNGNLSSSVHFENEGLISNWRLRVNRNPDQFLVMCKELKLIPEIWALYEWSNWLTPAVLDVKRRFDTVFYMCCINHKPKVVADKAETVLAQWISPTCALKDYYHNDIILVSPQIYEMGRLLNFSTVPDLVSFLAKQELHRVERWLSISVSCKDFIIHVIPGDDLYPASPDLESVSIHKVYTETKAELDQMYPNHNRTWSSFDYPQKVFAECNIRDLRSRVSPRLDLLENIKHAPVRAKF